ncbi:hypothetical protein ACLKA7_016162 [Drosophila subpalustris]
MFKLSICIIAALLVCAHGDHINKDAHIINESNSPPDAEGNFQNSFETSNGIRQQSAGNINGISGSFEYVSPDGETIITTYTADENGYHPQGDHLPTPPPIPDHVIRQLQYIKDHLQEQRI